MVLEQTTSVETREHQADGHLHSMHRLESEHVFWEM